MTPTDEVGHVKSLLCACAEGWMSCDGTGPCAGGWTLEVVHLAPTGSITNRLRGLEQVPSLSLLFLICEMRQSWVWWGLSQLIHQVLGTLSSTWKAPRVNYYWLPPHHAQYVVGLPMSL